MRYRRIKINGGLYFFTVVLANREQTLLTDNINLLRNAFRYTKANHPFDIIGSVILPEHLHVIWQLPEGDHDYSMRWSLIKGYFSRHLAQQSREALNPSRVNKRERGIWQHHISDERDLAQHIDYIHYNPVKHGYVSKAVDWPFSSIHQFIERGEADKNWGGDIEQVTGSNARKFGE
ncbi:REP-associated tyrosine transposase [Algibacillus agarilyticus]|uniref:REP-associated tyrosine transposase n=1 Tax=Algibacillus agarilyticus TaxID=2234133 RepID=UPI000DD0714F|nr:transposase [Algibacillus agarilyticus]